VIELNLPNKLTTTRIVLSLVIIFILIFPFHDVGLEMPVLSDISGVKFDFKMVVSGFLFIIASLTDFFDGHIARKRGLVTNKGKMLDAIADKILVDSVLIILASLNMINVLIPVVIVLRDIIVNAIKMESARKGKVVAAISMGKIKTFTLMVGIVLVFFNNFPFALINFNLADVLLYIALVLSILSMYEYYRINKKLIIDEK